MWWRVAKLDSSLTVGGGWDICVFDRIEMGRGFLGAFIFCQTHLFCCIFKVSFFEAPDVEVNNHQSCLKLFPECVGCRSLGSLTCSSSPNIHLHGSLSDLSGVAIIVLFCTELHCSGSQAELVANQISPRQWRPSWEYIFWWSGGGVSRGGGWGEGMWFENNGA